MGLAAFNRMRRLSAESSEPVTEQPEKPADDELQQLRERGKELGIPRAVQMGAEKLKAAIAALGLEE